MALYLMFKLYLLLALGFGLYILYRIGSLVIFRADSDLLKINHADDSFRYKISRAMLQSSQEYLNACELGKFLSALLIGGIVCYAILHFEFISQLYHFKEDYLLTFLCFSKIFLFLLIILLGLIFIFYGRYLAFNAPEKTLIYWSPLILVFCRPLRLFANLVGDAARFFVSRSRHGFDGLQETIQMSERQSSPLQKLAVQVFELGEIGGKVVAKIANWRKKSVGEIMTPRSEIVHIDRSATLDQIVAVFSAHGVSRLVVIDGELDNVVGILLAKDLIPYLAAFVGGDDSNRRQEEFKIDSFLRPPYRVPSSKKLDQLFEELKRQALHFAIILNERGLVDGVATLEDLLEEIVGEIEDEFDDPPQGEEGILKTKSGDLLVSGGVAIEKLNALYDLRLPAGDYATIAGCVLHFFGRMPGQNEVIEIAGHRIKIEQTTQTKIVSLRIFARRK
ncbi:MAG TPA: hemolysin family protein [Oligoflexia bacterium]|nr:hemolysin family protein [Oligoflexia bacterium]HMP27867.1 hemolysin family protein [Oligoflexia bacterium]